MNVNVLCGFYVAMPEPVLNDVVGDAVLVVARGERVPQVMQSVRERKFVGHIVPRITNGVQRIGENIVRCVRLLFENILDVVE